MRELLRDERKVLGLYDTTITATDPFPDRDEFSWPDPTLSGISPAYTMAVNRMLRSEIGVETDREYTLLSYEVNTAWKNDAEHHAFAPPPGATDDFRYGMALNPHMKAFITHGQYDLVTPYYASDRLRNLMRLDPQMADRLTVQHYGGGHMFYAWETSRHAFTAAIAAFVADATELARGPRRRRPRAASAPEEPARPRARFAELLALDRLDADLHGREARVVRAREVDVAAFDSRMSSFSLAIDADGESAAVALARLATRSPSRATPNATSTRSVASPRPPGRASASSRTVSQSAMASPSAATNSSTSSLRRSPEPRRPRCRVARAPRGRFAPARISSDRMAVVMLGI